MATIKQLKQMCDSYEKCGDCPLNDTCCGDSVSGLPDNADEIVDKWVKEHFECGVHWDEEMKENDNI